MNKKVIILFGLGLLFFIFGNIINFEGSSKRREKHKSNKDFSNYFIELTPEDLWAISNNILLSREYQTKIYKGKFINRTKAIEDFLPILSSFLNIPSLSSIDNGRETIRFQYIMNTKACGKSFNPRIRNYYKGYKNGTTTIDVKSATIGKEKPSTITKITWAPSDIYKDTAMQKFEWDVHPCKIKYSVESRLIIPFETQLGTCGDLPKYYPKIGDLIAEENLNNSLTILPLYSGWWYELEHTGILSDNMTEFKTALTLEYNSMKDAIEGIVKPINSGEWSIRIWSSLHGTNRWIKPTVKQLNENYFKLLEEIGSPDLPCGDEYTMDALEIE